MKKIIIPVILSLVLIFTCSCGGSSKPWPKDEFFSFLPSACDKISSGKLLDFDSFTTYVLSVDKMDKQTFLDYLDKLLEAGISDEPIIHNDSFISFSGYCDELTIAATWQTSDYEYRSQNSDFRVTFSK